MINKIKMNIYALKAGYHLSMIFWYRYLYDVTEVRNHHKKLKNFRLSMRKICNAIRCHHIKYIYYAHKCGHTAESFKELNMMYIEFKQEIMKDYFN